MWFIAVTKLLLDFRICEGCRRFSFNFKRIYLFPGLFENLQLKAYFD